MHDLEHRLADGDVPAEAHDAMLERYSAVQERFRMGDGYSIELRVATILRGLGFSPGRLRDPGRAPVGRLADAPGPGQAAAARARACCCSTSRPTTSTSRPATGSRTTSPATRTRSSWSRTTATSSTPWSTASPTCRCARSPTTSATTRSTWCSAHERVERLREAKKRQDEEIARVQEFVDRFRYQATKAAQVQSRIKMLEKIERIEVPAGAQAHPLPVPGRRSRAAGWCWS